MKMLDEIAGKKSRIANLCARGMAKTTLMFEYLIFYVAVFGSIEGFGSIDGMIYVSDSMDNGVKSARKNIEFRYYNSDFLQDVHKMLVIKGHRTVAVGKGTECDQTDEIARPA